MRKFLFGFLLAVSVSALGFIGGGVSSSVPVGTCFDFAGTVAPSGYQVADGSALPRAGSAFFGVVGTTWGVGDGSTTFNVPNFQRRKTVGSGGSGTAVLANTVGSVGGEEAHVLITAELAAHTHNVSPLITRQSAAAPDLDLSAVVWSTNGVTIGYSGASNGTTAGALQTVTSTSIGSGTAHNTRDPSAVVLKICKL